MSQLQITDPENVPQSIQDLVDQFGENEDIITNGVICTLSYDSRDRLFGTRQGSDHRITLHYAGFGGGINFIKSVGEVGWYIPLVWEFVGFMHARAGYGREADEGVWPDYERFFLGGINSLRGFDQDDLSPIDENGNPIGGDKFVQFNLELIFPLVKEAGLDGVIFFDTGDVYDEDEDVKLGDLRESAGFGFRWNSPVGPIRLEYGYILDPKPTDEKRSRWEFSMGLAF